VKLTTEGPHNAVSKEKSSEALLAHPVAYAKLPLLWQQPDNNRDVSVLGAILPTCGVKRKRFSGRCYLKPSKMRAAGSKSAVATARTLTALAAPHIRSAASQPRRRVGKAQAD